MRVADFGVARALAEAAWTEPAGAMVGTARYISPEAAEGKPVDGRADVYSLALVLYEAVTGTVPFVTDTTMGTLAARIGQPLPHHDALGPLDDVLVRAAAPDVASRLDAAGLAARLGALAAALPDAFAAAAGDATLGGLRPDQRVPGARGVRADRLRDRGGGRRRAARPGPVWERTRRRSRRGLRALRMHPWGRRRGRGRSSTPSPMAAVAASRAWSDLSSGGPSSAIPAAGRADARGGSWGRSSPP